ncbi:MAG: tRNA (adenosine(37)-N6)-dimethylallyltransferase MiaA [SAR202 cluster bacterium Io17-Chloro-G2]|nr:MAG: tRNA (adenosine(37)-N6)-dimethylallyltransferase MiaA [SAR202 cluster bacterium Io17-Chloro-G2]
MSESQTPLLFIVGPTGVGKTDLAIDLAVRYKGEIIGADSRQVYRHMDIGTAKPTAEQRRHAPHHLLDILNADQNFDVATFLSIARAAVADIRRRDALPIIAGGTGQYIWALHDGWEVPQLPPDTEFREAKTLEAEQKGAEVLHEELMAIDPVRAAQIHPQNVRRVIRALEIRQATNLLPSQSAERSGILVNGLVIGLTMERKKLYERIDRRVDAMMSAGFLAEVKRLAEMGFEMGKGPLASPGYREIGRFLDGEMTLDEAVDRTKTQTHRLVRRQYSWFKPSDPRIKWLDAAGFDLQQRATDLVDRFLAAKDACDTIAQHPSGRPSDEIH